MRLETIEKEADLYRGVGECYIHVERAAKSPIKCVIAGDRNVIAQAVYNLLIETAEQTGNTFSELLKLYKKAYKQFGVPKKEIQVDD